MLPSGGRPNSLVTSRHLGQSSGIRAFVSSSNRPYGFTAPAGPAVKPASPATGVGPSGRWTGRTGRTGSGSRAPLPPKRGTAPSRRPRRSGSWQTALDRRARSHRQGPEGVRLYTLRASSRAVLITDGASGRAGERWGKAARSIRHQAARLALRCRHRRDRVLKIS
jgi:hypothetical protein